MKEIQITEELIEEFLHFLEEKGRKDQTIRNYRGKLQRWYESLPEDKLLTEDALDRWAEVLREKGLAESSISIYLDTLNVFLKYLESPDLIRERVPYGSKKEATQLCVLTRNEYLLLLHAAKEKGYKRTYLLIKTIGGLGIRSTELQDLTVGSLKQGEIKITTRGISRVVKIYEPIRSELLAYAAEKGIDEGPIFITKDGLPMQHFLIWKEIKKVCRQMGLPEDKGIPSTLYDMYLETKRTLPVKSVEEADQKYLALLQKEEAIVGGNNSGDQKNSLIEEKDIACLADTMVKQYGNPFDKLSREEVDRVIKRLGESLSEILSRKYGCKITITYTRKEDA